MSNFKKARNAYFAARFIEAYKRRNNFQRNPAMNAFSMMIDASVL